VTVHHLEKVRRRDRFVTPASLQVVADVFGLDLSRPFVGYELRRRKWGTAVYVMDDGGLSINLSYYENVSPVNFKAARQWVKAVSQRYGWTLIERKSMRLRKP
jgi:hypothetical protein